MNNVEEREQLANELAESISQFNQAIIIRDAMSDKISKQLDAIKERSLDEAEPIETSDILELSKLARVYNDTLQQVALAFERRTKAGNAWHELIEQDKEEQ
jgi:hypothetical protein